MNQKHGISGANIPGGPQSTSKVAAMLSQAQTTKIKDEIKLIEAVLPECHESGLREMFLLWIEEWKKLLPKQEQLAKQPVGPRAKPSVNRLRNFNPPW